MDSVLVGLVFLAAGALLGGGLIVLLYREKLATASERGRNDGALELAAIKERLQAAQSESEQLEAKLSQAGIQANTWRDELDRARDDRAALTERVSRIPQLEEQRHELRRSRDDLQIKLAELTIVLDAERKQAGEKLALLIGAKDELKSQFENLANGILEDKSARFTEANRVNLVAILNPLNVKIQEFQKQVEDTYDKESKERLTLKNQIESLAALNAKISVDAINLTKALKGDSKAQGSWGEIILERVLDSSGLRRDEEYTVQGRYAGEDRAFQPDIVVNLPEGRHIVVDSKVSLTAYERYSSAETDEQRDAALKQHLASVRTHVSELSAKNYQNLYGLKSLDFVLMFIPVEPAYIFAIQSDKELFGDALKRNVLVVSPSNLIGILRTVAFIWRQENQNRNAQEIARQCAALYDKIVGFVDDLDEIGKKLGSAMASYDAARGKIASGRGNLIRQVEKIKALGVKPTKSFSKALLDQATDEAEEDPSIPSGPSGEGTTNVVSLPEERKKLDG